MAQSRENWEERTVQARQDRILRWERRVTWLGGNVTRLVNMSSRARLRLAAQLLRDRIVINLSRPVRRIQVRSAGRFAGTIVDPTSRSRPGEFPRADTTRLMKSIFYRIEESRPNVAIIGTDLDYGLILEVFRDRSFLIRTVEETSAQIQGILNARLP